PRRARLLRRPRDRAPPSIPCTRPRVPIAQRARAAAERLRIRRRAQLQGLPLSARASARESKTALVASGAWADSGVKTTGPHSTAGGGEPLVQNVIHPCHAHHAPNATT